MYKKNYHIKFYEIPDDSYYFNVAYNALYIDYKINNTIHYSSISESLLTKKPWECSTNCSDTNGFILTNMSELKNYIENTDSLSFLTYMLGKIDILEKILNTERFKCLI